MNKSIVDYALEIATEAHKGQKRWDGTPYIEHPKAVAKIAMTLYCQTLYSQDLEYLQILQCVALNHDNIEDCKMFANENELVDELFRRANKHNAIDYFQYREIVDGLKRLNKNNYESYLDFVLAAKGNRYSRFVKMADITHNLSDLKKGSMKDKYQLALYILEN